MVLLYSQNLEPIPFSIKSFIIQNQLDCILHFKEKKVNVKIFVPFMSSSSSSNFFCLVSGNCSSPLHCERGMEIGKSQFWVNITFYHRMNSVLKIIHFLVITVKPRQYSLNLEECFQISAYSTYSLKSVHSSLFAALSHLLVQILYLQKL